MKIKPASTLRNLARALATGVLLSLLFVYSVHLFGTWELENYRPDPETTSTVLLHNKCALFGKTHTLKPNTDISAMDKSIDGTKLGGSFMNFFDGHVIGIVILSVLSGGLIFALRQMK
jgi:hypothetical protein